MTIVNFLDGHEFDGSDPQKCSNERQRILASSKKCFIYRNFGGRIAAITSGSSIPDWYTPILTASWPSQNEFPEYPQDVENYNDIYATYPL